MSENEKLTALESRWFPTVDSEFPFSFHTKKGKQRRRALHSGHLQRFKWLAISRCEGKAGAWCSVCVLFSVSFDYMGQKMGKFVTRPLSDFSDLTGKNGSLDLHETSGFPAANAARAIEFTRRVNDPETHVDSLVDSPKRNEVLRNRQALASIVETIKPAAIQNISLRGHRDDGRIEVEPDGPDGDYPKENDDNFRMLLRFRVNSGDKIVEAH